MNTTLSALDFVCILLLAAAWQTSYLTGHVSNLGHPCQFEAADRQSVGEARP